MERTVSQIQEEIDQLKEDLKNVHGRKTEVYARIVGYYRSVRNWNKGKREEYNHRKLFSPQASLQEHMPTNTTQTSNNSTVNSNTVKTNTNSKNVSFTFFMRKTCPNCPPVKNCIEASGLIGEYIDVDSADGFEKASVMGIFAAPTVVFTDENGNECFRARSVKEITDFLANKEEVCLAV